MASMLWDSVHEISDLDSRTGGYYRTPWRQLIPQREAQTRGISPCSTSRAINVDMPCITVEYITWTPVTASLLNMTMFHAFANISMWDMELLYTIVPGTAILFDPHAHKLSDMEHFRQWNRINRFSHTRNRLRIIIILLGLNGDESGCNPTAIENKTISVPLLVQGSSIPPSRRIKTNGVMRMQRST